ncbi:MAG: SpoIIE family protein phosphatase [Clostridia bacterium]|nr:SpoIIE family protein phosphatase [Clostridia bacterium]
MQSEIRGRQLIPDSPIDRGVVYKLLGQLIPAAAGILMARCEIFGTLSPFGTILAASVPRGYVISSVIGVVIGVLLPGSSADALRCIATAIAVAGIRWALAELHSVAANRAFAPCAAFAATVLTGLAVSTSAGSIFEYRIMLYLLEGAVAAAGTLFACGAVQFVQSRRNISRAGRWDMCCIVSSAVVATIPLCAIRIAGFSPVTVAVMICTLIAAREFRTSGGAIGGISLGIAVSLSGGSMEQAGICAAAGLIASLFSPIGSILSATAFSVTCTLGTLGSGNIDVFFLIETLAASSIYPLIKREWLSKVLARPTREDKKRRPLVPITDISERLTTAAHGLSGVSETVCEVASKLDRLERQEPEMVYRRAAEKICKDCAIASHCWEAVRDETSASFAALTDILRREGSLSRANTPDGLRDRCARWGEMSDEINRLYADFAARESARRRIAQVRSVIAGQLGGVSEMLCELAEETRACDSVEPSVCAAAAQALGEAGYIAGTIRCVRSVQGQMTVTASVREGEDGVCEPEEVAQILGEALGMEFREPERFRGDDSGEYLLELVQQPPLSVEFGVAQHMCSGQSLCGDAYDTLLDGSGGAVMLISDGMGSGGRAAVDAAMTCGLLRRLLRAGFGTHGAMRVVNSSLLIKSDDESLATVDCVRINLFSGETTFCKAGAVQSYIRRGGKVELVEIPSLPLGIMREPDCDTVTHQLGEGDMVIMLSDGVLTDDSHWLENVIEGFGGSDPRELARMIISGAVRQRAQGEDDDITALVFTCRRR